ncbi:MAG: hypothetical protein EZS26_002926 [Candidatus Ordinivivax streblomastigis]|uniref:Uncharacterized protein n=1 Tax=Candidatus Ordinivivax streblomastigis TaxID=2540710 RepID=A0A5M8NYM3_9BACT|nr:MAG: hypothetical protein EZS26_002926 [Candidatus Ordinivivax streblomastigis]
MLKNIKLQIKKSRYLSIIPIFILPLPRKLGSGQICMLATTEKNAKNHLNGWYTTNHFAF